MTDHGQLIGRALLKKTSIPTLLGTTTNVTHCDYPTTSGPFNVHTLRDREDTPQSAYTANIMQNKSSYCPDQVCNSLIGPFFSN